MKTQNCEVNDLNDVKSIRSADDDIRIGNDVMNAINGVDDSRDSVDVSVTIAEGISEIALVI